MKDHKFKIGDNVWYWSRRKCQRPHKVITIIRSIDESKEWARVQIYETGSAGKSFINTQTIEIKRFHWIQ